MHVRYPHVRMAAEAPLEAALMLRLDLVVEFVRDPLADLGEHGTRVEPRREALEDRADDARGCAGLASAASAAPGCCTLTATSSPSLVRARCTWPSEASANGCSSKSANSCPTRASRSCSSTRLHAAEGDRRRARRQRAERQRLAAAIELQHREELRQLRACALEPAELRAEFLGQREAVLLLRLPGHRYATAFPSARRRPARARWFR